MTLERTLRHQRAQARATRTESAVVTAVEVERRLGRHLPTRAGPDRMTAEIKRDPRAGINIKVRPELRARANICATLEGLTVPERIHGSSPRGRGLAVDGFDQGAQSVRRADLPCPEHGPRGEPLVVVPVDIGSALQHLI